MVMKVSLRRNVRILLLGDRHVGKTSLILSLVSEEFPELVPSKAEEITIPPDVTPEMVPTHIVDYSEVDQTVDELTEEIQKAHVICLVYSVVDDSSIDRLSSHWLPFLRNCLVDTCLPIVLVGNKVDLVDYSTVECAIDIMEEYPEVESFVESSAKTLKNISEMFYYAQKAVLHPMAPIYISDKQELTPECINALTRIFKVCDLDNDGLLSDRELNAFQRRCFDAPLSRDSLEDVKIVIRKNINDGVSANNCITLNGFLFLHNLFMQRGRSHTTWTVLRKFGYNEDLQVAKDFLHPPLLVPADCIAELSDKGQQFFTALFYRFDKDGDGALCPSEQRALFALCPSDCAPWSDVEMQAMVATNSKGWITMQGFLCYWVLTTLHDFNKTLEYLAYFGYPISDRENQTTAVLVTREKQVDLLKKQTTRNVYVCHVIGNRDTGKTALCQSILRKQQDTSKSPAFIPSLSSDLSVSSSRPTTVNTTTVYGQEKYLVMREIAVRDAQLPLLLPVDVECDVACLLYDSSRDDTFKYIASLYVKYFSTSKIPVMLVAGKSDLPRVRQDYLMQPDIFCETHKLSPAHPFSSPNSDREVFVKLATMAAFPRFHPAWMLFYPDLTSHFYMFNLHDSKAYLWKTGLSVTIITLLGILLANFIRSPPRK
uniref:Mitochondrial Rho GTPase n=1 Tax=Cacopsylla melanoneura TaxID=428564 RepID=A0A8D8V3R0_9HEMI